MAAINSMTQNRILRTAIKDITGGLGRLHEQISTGLEAKTFADHGATNARRVISLRNETFQIASYSRTIDQLDMRATRVNVGLEHIHTRVNDTVTSAMKLHNSLTTPEDMARTAQGSLEDVYSNLVTEVAGHFIFSGTEANRSPLVPFGDIQAGVEAAIAAAVPANDPAAVVAAVSGFFADETNWYQGGTMPNGLEISRGRAVQPGILGNDAGLRDVLTGLSIIAFADHAAMGQADYTTAVDLARPVLATGLDTMRKGVARNGLLLSDLELTKESHEQLKTYSETQLADLEHVDVYEATTKLQALETQLQATYSLTARLRELTLTNYLR